MFFEFFKDFQNNSLAKHLWVIISVYLAYFSHEELLPEGNIWSGAKKCLWKPLTMVYDVF